MIIVGGLAGGLLSAIVGPQLNKLVFDTMLLPVFGGVYRPNPFKGTYLTIIVINLAGMLLFLLLDLPKGDWWCSDLVEVTQSSPDQPRAI